MPSTVVFFLTTLIATHTSEVPRRWVLVVCILSGALLVVDLAGASVDDLDVRAIAGTGYGLLLLATAFVVMRRVLRHRTITSRTLAGGVAAYLLVGLAFASLAASIALRDPSAYVAAHGGTDFAAMLYSFVTQATLGYYDVVPVSDFARSLATLQAVVGQIYLVIVVARLVSLFGTRRDIPATELPVGPPMGDRGQESSESSSRSS